MTIGKLAAAGGVGVEIIRFYRRRGLLAEPNRSGGVRRYDGEALMRLQLIRSGQTAGFTIEEIKTLLSLDAGTDHVQARHLAEARVKALDEKIAELARARSALARLAKLCSASNGESFPIITAFEH